MIECIAFKKCLKKSRTFCYALTSPKTASCLNLRAIAQQKPGSAAAITGGICMCKDSKKTAAMLLLALTAALWSIGGLLIKKINAHPLAIAGVRSAISGVIILLYVRKPRFNWSFPQIAAAVAYSFTVITFVAANKYTTAANAILLQYTAPVYVALLGGWLLKEKPSLIDWAAIAAVFGGMLMFFIGNLDTGSVLGNIFGAVSGIGFGLFPVFMRMQKDGSPVESVLLGNLITAVIGIPFLFRAVPDSTGWLCLTLLGIVQLGIPYILFSIAIKNATALEACLITVIEPILNPIWVFLLLGETPGIFSLIGGMIVLSAIIIRSVLSSLSQRRMMPQEASAGKQ